MSLLTSHTLEWSTLETNYSFTETVRRIQYKLVLQFGEGGREGVLLGHPMLHTNSHQWLYVVATVNYQHKYNLQTTQPWRESVGMP